MLRVLPALFRAALALTPPGFRREYGVAMCADFASALADERMLHGAPGAISYALGACADLLSTALREYLSMFLRDLVYALRALRKTPSFSAVVIATLALAIGANAAVFSILHAVVLAPLPYADPDRLVSLQATLHGKPFQFSLPDYSDVVSQNPNVFENAAAFESNGVTMTGRGAPRRLANIETTPRLFDTLGVRPQIGRFADSGDTARGATPTVVLSDELWRRAFAADPQAVGEFVKLDGVTYRVIGIAPPDFHQPRIGAGYQAADLWTFLPENGAGTEYSRGYHTFVVVSRLRSGVSLAQTQAAVDASVLRLIRLHPADDTGYGSVAMTLTESIVGSVRALLFALFAAVGAVLLVACANVANLLLSRAASREAEFSVRVAVGASRGRIVAQLLVETFVLAIAGGVLGIGLAYGAVSAFVAFHPPNIPRADFVSVDAAAVLYTFGVVAFCTLAAGLAPAFASSTRDVAIALKSAGRGGDAHRGLRARSLLVACEIAMTVALVVAAGLVVKSFVALTGQPLGFDATGISIIGGVDTPDTRYPTDAARAAFMDLAIEKTRDIPGVKRIAWGFGIPFSRSSFGTTFTIPGRSFPSNDPPNTRMSPIGTDYFAVLQATIREGRAFAQDDRMGTQPVATVNETFARKFFGDRSPIGAYVVPDIQLASEKSAPQRRIVGVVADLRTSFSKPADPTIYVPARQYPLSESSLVVEAEPGTNPAPAISAQIAALDPLLAPPDVLPMSKLLARDVAVQQLSVAALCALAFIALALSIAGVFAVVSYGVTQRTHEFGVRMALGADARGIVRTVVGGAMRLAFAGIVLGLLVAGAGTRLLTDQLFDTQPLDPMTFGVVTVLVVFAALVAAIVPARRATLVDPIVALRYE